MFMIRQDHHERNKHLDVRGDLVEGHIQNVRMRNNAFIEQNNYCVHPWCGLHFSFLTVGIDHVCN